MKQRADGFVLVPVLAMLALCAALVGSAFQYLRNAQDTVVTTSNSLRLDELIRTGVELAAYHLIQRGTPAVAVNGQWIELDDGVVGLSVHDEAGRIDLNGSDPAVLARMYREAGLRDRDPADFADLVRTWRERGKPPVTDPARTAAATEPTLREGFGTVEELARLPGLAATEIDVLAPHLTVNNPSGKVNPLAASDTVLRAIGLPPQDIAEIRGLHRLPTHDREVRLGSLVERNQGRLAARSAGAFGLVVTARRRSGATRVAEVIVIRSRAEQEAYFVTAWKAR